MLSPTANVVGAVTPLMLNPVPVAVACDNATLEPPVFVITAVRFCT
jgi:hypothetical protein